MSEFITDAASAAAWRDELDRAGKKLVFTNGCFDVLHVGHVRYLREARALGDALLIAVNGDASVRELKGPNRPVNEQADRAEVLCGLESVDRVVIFDEPRVTGLIEKIRPHIYAKGGDYTVDSLIQEERRALDRIGAEIQILSLVPGKSTSDTLSKLRSSDEPGERKLRIAVLGSANGSNFEAIAEAVENQQLLAEIQLVISDVADSGILERARRREIPAFFIEPGGKRALLSAAAEKEIIDRLKAAEVDLVVLAGFMRIVKTPLLEVFPDRILNVHPSLLPRFPGLNAPRQAIEAGVGETGCTVHLVSAGIDDGPILGQASVPVNPGDTPETLHARIQTEEHRLFPQIIGEYGAKIRQ
ncbi:MAG: formyltetrahydrofolate-dependent phosphoribosylglycinamide formyltransferase [Verrucomicrobiales bacterium]|jgi:formyltetrahydrofolate-dependent phosphoribosylglycinamide formyltransferase